MKRILLLLLTFLGFQSVYAQDLIIENGSVNACSEMFYDTGGPDATYSPNQDFTYTICPENDGDFSYMDFEEFELGDGDSLTIYD
ncbi:MAG: hypothetical protein ABR595_10670, partial [Psychroflexus sp.]